MRFLVTFVALSGIGTVSASAQDVKPAPVIEIYRETIKEGRGAAHEKVETDYAAVFRKANHPAHYVAMATVSGPQEVWFLQPMPSFAVTEDYDKASEKEPLKSAMAMMDSRDGELRASSRSIWAVFRPDLSYGVDKFKPGKTRYVMIGTFHVRMGHDEDFAAGGKQYLAAFAKAGIDECTLAYQVVAGASGGTYLFFTMMDSMKFMDGYPARMQAIQQAMGEENFARFMKNGGDVIASIDSTILRVKPGMSYPTQDMLDADPAFWKPKPVAAKPAASAAATPAVPEKKPAAQ